jgi:hypothetical protein
MLLLLLLLTHAVNSALATQPTLFLAHLTVQQSACKLIVRSQHSAVCPQSSASSQRWRGLRWCSSLMCRSTRSMCQCRRDSRRDSRTATQSRMLQAALTSTTAHHLRNTSRNRQQPVRSCCQLQKLLLPQLLTQLLCQMTARAPTRVRTKRHLLTALAALTLLLQQQQQQQQQ